MSWSTNFHQTKSDCEGASAAENASTAGSASPSLSPDSRFSEWRMTRGTRGLVTTVEERTGSVGDSNAPSRNDSVQSRSVSTCVATATIPQVSGIASTSLRNGSRHPPPSNSAPTPHPPRLGDRQPPLAAQHLRLDLQPVAEEDQDQRDRGQAGDEARARVEVEH